LRFVIKSTIGSLLYGLLPKQIQSAFLALR
jgi:hypothetical protein